MSAHLEKVSDELVAIVTDEGENSSDIVLSHGDMSSLINDYLIAVSGTNSLLGLAKTLILLTGDSPEGDTHVLLRIRSANLEAITVPPDQLASIPRRAFLTPVELAITGKPTVYRLGIPDFDKPESLDVIEILREAGIADEVDEAFIGGDDGPEAA